jgi:hypothetical protein
MWMHLWIHDRINRYCLFTHRIFLEGPMKFENPTMRGPLENNARRYAALAEKLEAARRNRAVT